MACNITQGERQRVRMMDLTPYLLTGLAAVVIIALCAAFNNGFPSIGRNVSTWRQVFVRSKLSNVRIKTEHNGLSVVENKIPSKKKWSVI
jgi:hypothetical protein